MLGHIGTSSRDGRREVHRPCPPHTRLAGVVGTLGIIAHPGEYVHRHGEQNLGERIAEDGEVVGKFQGNEAVDDAPQLRGNEFGVVPGTNPPAGRQRALARTVCAKARPKA